MGVYEMKNIMPFLFYIPADSETSSIVAGFKKVDKGEYHVIIARYGYSIESTAWMDDERLGKDCLVPSLDREEEHHVFGTEKAAVEFIAEWWKTKFQAS